jgi:hypothetical protein
VYEKIASAIELPDDFAKIDDALAGVSTNTYIQMLDNQENTTYQQEQNTMRSNIYLAGKQYDTALQYL